LLPECCLNRFHHKLVVAVRVAAGPVAPLGLPAALLAASYSAVPLAQRLADLGVLTKVLKEGGASWSGMVPVAVEPGPGAVEPGPGDGGAQQRGGGLKELLQFTRADGSADGIADAPPLELTGTICPAGLYDAAAVRCTWADRADAAGAQAADAGAEGDDDKGAASEPSGECPLCAFIKGGGCAEAFAPFQACISQQADADERRDAQKKASADGTAQGSADNVSDNDDEAKGQETKAATPNCMPLFAPVAACMVADEAKRAYYAKFIADFPHLFEDPSKTK
jgi:hypothetical protein